MTQGLSILIKHTRKDKSEKKKNSCKLYLDPEWNDKQTKQQNLRFDSNKDFSHAQSIKTYDIFKIRWNFIKKLTNLGDHFSENNYKCDYSIFNHTHTQKKRCLLLLY